MEFLKTVLVAFLLGGLIALGSTYQPPGKLEIAFNNYSFEDVLEEGILKHKPDPSYKWLVINITVRNNTSNDIRLSWITDKFQFVANNGNTYDMQLVVSNIPGELPTLLPPKDQRTGDIYFHVPEGIDVNTGRLIFHMYGEKSRTGSLDKLPQK